jgi:hypothetical protein
MDETDTNQRTDQLYSLLAPYAASAQALLDRWARDDPLDALALEEAAPEQLVSLARRLSELPISEVAELLDEAVAAEKEGEAARDLKLSPDALSTLDAQVRSASEEIQAFAREPVPLPAPLSSELRQALKAEEVRLERALATARARMVTKHDLKILRRAEVPRDTIAAIVRDAPTQDDVDQLAAQLGELRRLLASSADGAQLAEQLDSLDVLAGTALELLGPLLDPRFVAQLNELAEPVIEAYDRGSRGG